MKTSIVTPLKLIAGLTLATACLLAQSSANPDSSTGLVLRGRQTRWPTHELRPLVLLDGRMLVGVADSVYMLDASGKQSWKYQEETLAAEPAFNAARNEIAVVMHDLLFVRLDAATGKVKWTAPSTGRGAFRGVSAYENGFLIVVDMSGYRDGGSRQLPDRLEYWGDSDKDFWYIDFPQKAELLVDGTKFYALFRDQDEVRLKNLHAPGPHRRSQ